MQRRSIKFGRAVEVSWIDSKGRGGWHYDPRQPRDPAYVRTLAYVVQCGPDALTVAAHIANEGESFDDFTIPWGCIKVLHVLPEEYSRDAED